MQLKYIIPAVGLLMLSQTAFAQQRIEQVSISSLLNQGFRIVTATASAGSNIFIFLEKENEAYMCNRPLIGQNPQTTCTRLN